MIRSFPMRGAKHAVQKTQKRLDYSNEMSRGFTFMAMPFSLYRRYLYKATRQILATFTASGPGGDVTRAVKPQLWSSPENWEGTIWHALVQMKTRWKGLSFVC